MRIKLADLPRRTMQSTACEGEHGRWIFLLTPWFDACCLRSDRQQLHLYGFRVGFPEEEAAAFGGVMPQQMGWLVRRALPPLPPFSVRIARNCTIQVMAVISRSYCTTFVPA